MEVSGSRYLEPCQNIIKFCDIMLRIKLIRKPSMYKIPIQNLLDLL
jgi:hypothetical protein